MDKPLSVIYQKKPPESGLFRQAKAARRAAFILRLIYACPEYFCLTSVSFCWGACSVGYQPMAAICL